MDVELGDGGVCWGGDADPIQLLHSTMLARGWDSAVCRVLKHRAAARRPLHHECHVTAAVNVGDFIGWIEMPKWNAIETGIIIEIVSIEASCMLCS